MRLKYLLYRKQKSIQNPYFIVSLDLGVCMRTLVKILLVLFLVLTYGCDVASQSGNDQNNDVNTDQGNNGSQPGGYQNNDVNGGQGNSGSQPGGNGNTGDNQGGNAGSDSQPDGDNSTPTTPTVDFSWTDNGDGTVTCKAQVTGAVAQEYAWQVGDDILRGETVVLRLNEGTHHVKVFAKINGTAIESVKEVTIGKQYIDDVYRYLFQKQETDTQYMYFALKIKGTSNKNLFRQNIARPGEFPDYAYARDLHFQVKDAVATSGGIPTAYSNFTETHIEALRKKNIYIKGYNTKTGFANEEGSSLEFPFYYGDDNFRVLRTSNPYLTFTFEVFTVWDTTKDSILGNLGHPDIISMRSGNPLKIEIPMSSFDEDIHKNIALLTVDFTNYESPSNPKPIVTFDKFVEK